VRFVEAFAKHAVGFFETASSSLGSLPAQRAERRNANDHGAWRQIARHSEKEK